MDSERSGCLERKWEGQKEERGRERGEGWEEREEERERAGWRKHPQNPRAEARPLGTVNNDGHFGPGASV